MLKFIAAMTVPLYVFIYTLLFGRWLWRRRIHAGALSAFMLAMICFTVSTVLFWRLFT